MACNHSALYSGEARYLREARQLQMVLVCDGCGAERAHLGRIDYFPNPRRLGAHLAELTARELDLDTVQVDRVRFAALVCAMARDHISPEILRKEGPLTDEEWREVRRQPELGAALLSDASAQDIREWILCHRERSDGTGYPRGLLGHQIPLEARILSVVDAYTAMVGTRPHRPARTHEGACAELVRCGGTQFDAVIVEAFVTASARRNQHLTIAA